MFRNASIGKKLLYAFSGLTVISFLIGYSGVQNIERNTIAFDEIISGTAPRIQALLEMKNVSNEIGHNALLIQTASTENITNGRVSASDSKSLILANLERLLHWVEQYRRSSQGSNTFAQESFLSSVNESKSMIIAATLEYIDAKELGVENEIIAQKEVLLNEHINNLKELIGSAIANETEDLRIQKMNAEKGMKTALLITISMSVLSVCFALLSWILLSRLIVRPLRSLRDATHAVAGGNLEYDFTIKSKDEIGDLAVAFRNMTDRLRESHEVLMSSNDELENIQKKLEKQLDETKRMNEHMINRELKMIELKKEIATLKGTPLEQKSD